MHQSVFTLKQGFLTMCVHAAAAAKLLQLCPTLCDPIDRSPPGSSVPGILQARTLEWVAISFSNACMHAKLLQLCATLCDPMDSSSPGSAVHRILQARTLEWVAVSFSSVHAKSLQSSLTLCDLLDCSLPISSVHWIFQGKILEWVAMPSYSGTLWPRDQTYFSYVSCIGRPVHDH